MTEQELTSFRVLRGVSVVEMCGKVRACWDALFRSRYVQLLEAENARLRLKLERLELRAQVFPGEAWRPAPQDDKGPAMVARLKNSRSVRAHLRERMWRAAEEAAAESPAEGIHIETRKPEAPQ